MPIPIGLEKSVAPIFVIADDDREALERLLSMLNTQWYYIPVWNGEAVVRYARQLATTAVFMADSISYHEGGAPRLLQELIDQVGKPVIVLAESWSPQVQAQWKSWGAHDCIPHPTRSQQRLENLRSSMQEVVLMTNIVSPPLQDKV